MNNSPFDMHELLQQTAHSIEPRPEFVDELWKEIRTTPVVKRRAPVFRLRLVSAMTVFFLLATAFIVGPQKIVQAFENLIGYLPGIGFVEEGDGTLYLPEPLNLTQEGVTFTVDQAVSDGNNLIVSLRIENIPPREGGGFDCMYTENNVQLPDGKNLHVMGGESSGKDTTFTSRLEFMPLPQDVTDFQLQVALPEDNTSCNAPREWLIDLSLAAKPGDVTLMPVYEIPTAIATDAPAEDTSQESIDTQASDSNSTAEEQFELTLERIVPLDKGLRIGGKLLYPTDQYVNASCNFYDMQVKDAAGEMVAIEPPDEGNKDNEWAIVLPDNDYHYPLTIECRRVSLWSMLSDGPAFSFDAGSEPVVGQTWEINQILNVLGHEVDIKTVEVVGKRIIFDGEPPDDPAEGRSSIPGGYRIEYQKEDTIDFVDFSLVLPSTGLGGWSASGGEVQDLAIFTAGSSGGKVENGLYYTELDSPGELYTGNISIQISNLDHHLEGSWQVQWQPPEGY